MVVLGCSGVFGPDEPEEPKAPDMGYEPVEDKRKGPSTVRPGGRRGASLDADRGVIRKGARQIDRRKKLVFPSKPKECRRDELVTDVLKKVANDLDQGVRAAAPLSVKEEIRLGNTLHKNLAASAKFRGKLDTAASRKWRAYLARVAQPLLAEVDKRDIPYRIHTIDLPEVNAFALPGGHIYFYTGLLKNRGGRWIINEAELAGVVAHEVAHVDLGHPAAVYYYLKRFGLVGKKGEKPGKIALAMARHSFSTAQEDEADRKAAVYMLRAQYSTAATVALWRRWSKRLPERPEGERGELGDELRNLMRTHSSPRERICNVMLATNEELGKLRFDRFYVGKSNLKRRIARTKRQY